MVIGAWSSSGNANGMWDTTATCIREATREMMGVSRGNVGDHQGGTQRSKGKWKPRSSLT